MIAPTSIAQGPDVALWGAQRGPRANSFESVLKSTRDHHATAASDHVTEMDPAMAKKTRESAETLVAQALIAPLLAQLRETNRAAEPFGVSDAEKRLGPIFDEKVAIGIVRRARFDLVSSVERSIVARAAGNQGPKASVTHQGTKQP
jgi:hypothetical protein